MVAKLRILFPHWTPPAGSQFSFRFLNFRSLLFLRTRYLLAILLLA